MITLPSGLARLVGFALRARHFADLITERAEHAHHVIVTLCQLDVARRRLATQLLPQRVEPLRIFLRQSPKPWDLLVPIRRSQLIAVCWRPYWS